MSTYLDIFTLSASNNRIMQNRFRILLIGVSVVAASFLSLSQGAEAATQYRVLHFPRHYCVGQIILLEKPTPFTIRCQGIKIANAQGDISVPLGKPLKFVPSSAFFEHPECLLKLPPDAFECIELRFMSMADGEDNFSDKVIPFVHHLSGLKNIDFDKSETTDKGMAQLGAMPNAEFISFFDSQVTGASIKSLSGCKNLRNLRFGSTVVQNEDLRDLNKFARLERIGLARVNLSSKHLEYVAQCQGLKELEISYNGALNDDAVPFLLKLPKLVELNIDRSSISVAGLEKLGKLRLQSITLPKDFGDYTKDEQRRLRLAFPAVKLASVKRRIDSDTKTIFAPFTRH